jgi:anti-anti-sigma factor
LVLAGELDLATIQLLQDKIDEIMVPGQPIVLDLADLTFLDTSGMHCFVGTFEATGTPSSC